MGLAWSQWFNRTADVDPGGTITITPRQIYIIPTPFGLAFGILLIGMLVGSNNYGINLGFALTFLLAGIGLAAMLQTWRNLTHLRIHPGNTEAVFAGDAARFPLYCRNERPSNRSGLQFRIASDSVACDIPGNAGERLECPLPAARRGLLSPERWTLFTYFPLGMFYSWAYFETRQSAMVYPRPVDPDIPLEQLFRAGFIQQFTQDDSGDFHGHRKYQPGDSPGRLDWKALARGRGTLVKEFASEDDDDLWLDFEDVLAQDTESRLSVLCRAVLELSRSGLRFGLRLPGTEIPPATGESHRVACLEALALFGR